MISKIKFFFKNLYKKIIINFFIFFYGKPKLLKKNIKDKSVEEYKVVIDKNKYKLFQFLNGVVYTDSNDTTAYISKNKIISEASMQYYKFDSINSFNEKISKNETLSSGTPKFIKRFKGNVLSLLAGGASKDNFTHWLTDVIPRLKIFSKKFNLSKIDKFYVPNLKYNFQKESLAQLGIKENQIINGNKYKHITANNIYATSHPCHFHPMKIKKWSLNYIRNLYSPKKKTKKYSKIFIERDQIHLLNFKNLEKSKNLRILLNEKEIKEFLKLQGFVIIKPEKYSFIKQVEIFYNANFVIGMYGAAMMMISFCKKNTKVLELKPIKGGNEFKNISRLIGLKHKQINLKPIFKSSTPQNGLINCPIQKIKKQLNFK